MKGEKKFIKWEKMQKNYVNKKEDHPHQKMIIKKILSKEFPTFAKNPSKIIVKKNIQNMIDFAYYFLKILKYKL